MVKNIFGGTGSKKVSRKGAKGTIGDYDLNDPNIITVSVYKALGNSRFYVLRPDGTQLICHIPSRFSGRNKHKNFVAVQNVILVSLRDYEKPPKNCDYMKILQPVTPVNFFLNTAISMTAAEEEIIFRNDSTPLDILPEEKGGEGGQLQTTSFAFEDIDFDAI